MKQLPKRIIIIIIIIIIILIEKDHFGDWSAEKDCCWSTESFIGIQTAR